MKFPAEHIKQWLNANINHRIRLYAGAALAFAAVITVVYYCRQPASPEFTITDQLDGNIFPSAILSLATTDEQVIKPVDSLYVGNPKSCIAVHLKSGRPNSVVRIELEGTPFYARSVSEFVLPEARTEYTVYPDIQWNYEALRHNVQAEPVSVVATVEMNGVALGQRMRTYSVRSVNECLLGYNAVYPDGKRKFVSTRIVRRFLGYQSGTPASVDKQVYALWHVLQKRNFKYSSISNSSLSSNVVYSQRVRTFDDAFSTSQINCVDGSVLFASLLRAVNITPVLVQMPGHMFVGYYRDKEHKDLTFLETTMIGDVYLDDYFPEERLDSTMRGRTQSEMSKLTFEKSKEYANREYRKYEKDIRANKQGFMFVEISKAVRAKIQPIGC